MINGKVIYNRIPNASRTHPEERECDSIRKNTRKQATGTADYRLLKAYNVKNKAPNTLPCQFFPLN